MEEIWKDIEGYEGIYQISNQGRVKSLGNSKSRKEKILKPVFQFDRQGNFIKEYPSLMEIQRQNGFKMSSISKCCKNKLKQAYGYVWKYKSEA